MDGNNQEEAPWSYTKSDATDSFAGSELNQAKGVPLPQVPEVSWSASEFVSHEKNAVWYLGLFAGTLVLVALIYLITSDAVASVVVFLACIIVSTFAGRKPAVKNYKVGESGIVIGERSYRYGEFRSFSIVEEGAIDSIWLKPLKRLSPVVVMYFAPEDEQKIVDVLSNFLPHEDRELDVIDRMSRRMRF